MNEEKLQITKLAMFAKSFYMLGDSLNYCYDCKYCRLNGEKQEEKHYQIIPSELNSIFTNIPVAVNLYYGDPLLQVENTVYYLKQLEKKHHKGPVVIITKGDFSKFPDIPFELDLHIAFSTFGVNSPLDGSSMERFRHNLEQIKIRKNNYKYSIEYRPIIYQVNDTVESFESVLLLAQEYGLAIGYSGLQGKPESVKIWEKEGISLKPYPGYQFGHKKMIDEKVVAQFELLAERYQVPVFRKTSCLFSYVHELNRDYNAHYYRPDEVGCNHCPMKKKCFSFKEKQSIKTDLRNIIPFSYKIIEKKNHECILKKKGICEFPTENCSHISGKLIKINDKITTTDVRLIKWLTGMTVDADFIESPYMSESWLVDENKSRKKSHYCKKK
ncbi:MAG: hypothetical protein KH135_04055 [Firmicutes bacterium]|nr:hypothetical protein [Bacillota bacterium]